jgi:ELWxxDGT repeat protein
MKNLYPIKLTQLLFASLLLLLAGLWVLVGQAEAETAVTHNAAALPTTTVQMLKDINPGGADSYPDDFFSINGILYFSGFDDAHGLELWRSDGTEAGTYMVKDINPGAGHSVPTEMLAYSGYSNESDFYFLAKTDDVHSYQIWKSDGTAAGTVQAMAYVDDPRSLAVVGDTLYFFANDPLYGQELWANNGTYSGSWLVQDINPGPANSYVTQYPVALGDKLLFIAYDGAHGIEPWISDGAIAGTQLVKDIHPDPSFAGASGYFVKWGGLAYFNGNDNLFGGELWQTDGTSAGTVRVAAVSSSIGMPVDILGVFNGQLYFLGSRPARLWATDGTESGTHMVHDFGPQVDYGNSLGAATPFNNGFCFTYIGSRLDTGSFVELWCSDGQTAEHLDIIPTNDEEIQSVPVVLGNTLYFTLEDNTHGLELWQSDGTVAGSQLVQDINPSPYMDSSPQELMVVGDHLFFSADDGVNGRELWLLTEQTESVYLPMIIR